MCVMALGYGLGPWLAEPTPLRKKRLLLGGGIATLAFVVLRAVNLYADPSPWSAQPRGVLFTLLSFLDCTKYPPSLDYLLMTLGPAAIVWGLASGRDLRWAAPIITYGRVPLFFYVLHLPLLHALALGWAWLSHREDLVVVYAGWALGIGLLWPLCYGMQRLKARHRGVWWTAYI
jgi:uncharacterized membrane protein